jgi:hypothetical protein
MAISAKEVTLKVDQVRGFILFIDIFSAELK